MSSDSSEELDRLISRMLDRQLDVAEGERLSSLLLESSGAVERYHELLDNHEAICAIYPGDAYESSLRSIEPQSLTVPVQGAARLASDRWRLWASGIVAVAASIAVTLWFPPTHDPHIATLIKIHGALQWTGDGGQVIQNLQTGRRLTGGTLECLFADSWGEIEFIDGTTIVVSGRSILTFSNGMQKELRLLEGRLSADVAPQSQGRPLLIHTPTAKLEVLGTRFDLVVEPSASQLSVAEGHVLVTRLKDGNIVEVPAERRVRASAEVREEFKSEPLAPSVTTWRSDLPEGVIHGKWLPEFGGNIWGLRASPLFRQNGQGKSVVMYLAAVEISGQSPVSLRPGSVLRIHGKIDTPQKLTIGMTVQHPNGGFGGKYTTTRPAKAFLRKGDFFDLDVPVDEFAPDDDRFQRSPIDLEICDWWCSTLETDAGLSILRVELVPSR